MRVYFEDQGQNFLWWDVNESTGIIEDCGPLQSFHWVNGRVRVERESLIVGFRPFYYKNEVNAAEKWGDYVKYKIIEILGGNYLGFPEPELNRQTGR